MSVKLAFLATLGAKEGKGGELGEFLRAGRELAVTEEGTVTWYAFRIDENHYGIFDTFETKTRGPRTSAAPSPRRSARSPASCWRAIRRSGLSTSSPLSKSGGRSAGPGVRPLQGRC
jgi:hypothetical protein